MKRVLFSAFLVVLFLMPGCAGSLTLVQQQQNALNAFSAQLTVLDTAALACINAGVPACVNSKAAILADAQKLFTDVGTAQTVINSGADASTNLQAIGAEIVTLVGLIPQTQAKT